MNDLIAVEKIAQWQKLKALLVDSVSSPITKRVYNMAAERVYGMVSAGTATRLHQSDGERVEGIARRASPRVVVHHY
jgi:hypothetical protein